MIDHAKPAIEREADVEALVIAALRRLGRRATSAEIWRLVDAAFDVRFEVRRAVIGSLLDREILVLEEHRDHSLPEPCMRLYRLHRDLLGLPERSDS